MRSQEKLETMKVFRWKTESRQKLETLLKIFSFSGYFLKLSEILIESNYMNASARLRWIENLGDELNSLPSCCDKS